MPISALGFIVTALLVWLLGEGETETAASGGQAQPHYAESWAWGNMLEGSR